MNKTMDIFHQMMSEIHFFGDYELEMNRQSKSITDCCNLLLFRYDCACELHKKYKEGLCFVVLNGFYNKESILSEIKVLLSLICLSGEKHQLKFKKELSEIGL